MARKFCLFFSCSLVAALFVVPTAFAQRVVTNTTSGTINWSTTGIWSPNSVPGSADDARVTNSVAGNQTITNATGTINFLAISNSLANATNTVIQGSNIVFTSKFGIQLGARGVMIITTNAQFGQDNNNTFDLNAGGGQGTLVLSNAYGANAFTLFLVKGTVNTATTNALVNAGTIQFVNGALQNAGINYGQTLGFTNQSNGTIVKNGVGTGNFTGTFGTQNRGFVNDGTIFVNQGVMNFDPRDAFSIGGFSNTVNGKIFISNNATAMVTRTTNAWANGASVANMGSVSLFGGSYVAQAFDTQTLGNFTNVNSGVISGFGSLGWSFRNDAGTIAATGGVLNVLGKIIGGAGTFAAGGVGTSGTLIFAGGNSGGAAGTLTGNIIATNSSAIIFTGGSDWTIGAGAIVRFANSNLSTAQRGSLISSNSGVGGTLFLANQAFIQNFGTLLVTGANGINYGQIGADGTDMTNRLFMGGVGTFTGNFGGVNQALNNLGTIATVAGSLLSIDSRDANHFGGFQNGLVAGDATGTVVIASNSTFSIRRSDAAWFAGGVSPTNLGTINMQGGTLLASNTDFGAGKVDGGKFVNAAGGLIAVTGTNNVTNYRVLQNNGLITLAASANLTNTFNSGGTLDNSGGVIQMSGSGSIAGPGVAVLISPNYISTSSSAITNSGGGSGLLQFINNAPVTNKGTINFVVSTGAADANAEFGLSIGTTSNNVFRNEGTFAFGISAATTRRSGLISNQMVNAGLFALTNSSSAAGGSLNFAITGVTGTSLTNESTGTMRFVADGTGTGVRNIATLNTGGLINQGTITFLQSGGTAGNNNDLILSEAGTTFTNRAGGQVIVESGNIGDVRIRAATVNLGTNIIRGGSLTFATGATGTGNGIFTNQGVVVFDGGANGANLDANVAASAVIVNNGGLIRTISGQGTIVDRVANINGGTLEAFGGTMILDVTPNQLANITVTNAGTLQVGAAGTLAWTNSGSIFLKDGNIVSGNLTNRSAATLKGAGTITGTVINQNLATIEATNGRLIFAGSLTNNGTVNVRGGASGGTLQTGTSGTTSEFILTNATAGYINMFGGTIVDHELVNAGHIATVAGGGLISNALINLAGAFIDATNGTLTLTPDLQNFGVITNGNGATLSVGSSANGTVTNSGTIALNDGNFFSDQITNTGTIVGQGTISGQILNTTVGLVDATNGSLRLLATPSNLGILRAEGGGASSGTLQVGATGGTAWGNNGTVDLRGGTVASGSLTNVASAGTISGQGTISGRVINNNFMYVTNGTLFLTSATGAQNNGTMDVAGGNLANMGTLNAVAAWNNAGTVLLKGGEIVGAQFNNSSTLTAAGGTNASVLVNQSGGLVDITGTLTILNSAGSTVTNLSGGTYKAEGAYLRIFASDGTSNDFRNAGTFTFNSGTIAVGNFVNAGTFNASHGSTGTISSPANGIFSNLAGASLLVNSGTVIYNGGSLANSGTIDTRASGVLGVAAGVNFVNSAGGVIQNTNGTATLGLRAAGNTFLNLGTMTVLNGASINMLNTSGTGTEWTNSGSVFLGNGATAGILNSGTIDNNGSITANNATINMQVGGSGTRPFSQTANGQVIVSDGGTLTVTHLASDHLSVNGGTVTVGNGSALRIFTDVAATTNAVLVNGANIGLNGGTIISANITNSSGGTIKGFGTLSFDNGPLVGLASNLYNAGSILANNAGAPLVLQGGAVFNQTNGTIAASSGNLIVTGTLANNGTVTLTSSVGTFNSTVVNSGAWITDPSTLVFQNTFTVTPSGFVSMTPGDVYVFTNGASAAADFVNLSSQSNAYNTANGKFVFDNTLGLTQNLVVAGHNLGPGSPNPVPNATNEAPVGLDLNIPGFSNNFALGTLEISDFTTVRVSDAFSGLPGLGTNDGLTAGLYLDNLLMGFDSFLIISSNVQVYFKSSNTWDTANFLLEGNPTFDNAINGLHQLAVVPEPGVVFLWLCGFVTVYAARRRRNPKNRG